MCSCFFVLIIAVRGLKEDLESQRFGYICYQGFVFSFWLQKRVSSVVFAFASIPMVGTVIIESFSLFWQEMFAYWPIVISLTEHSLSLYSGPYPACAGVCHFLFGA